ncbi:MAG: histidine kinase, partial [Thermodesulfobacteriota bacterium]|nr:histidine kinase [Thermodesulfobacteriota bacterium]
MKKLKSSSNASKELRDRAALLLEKNSSDIEKVPSKDIQDLIEDLQIHHVELEMQKEELRKAHEELWKIRQVYEDLYDLAPIGYLTLDESNLIYRVNIAGTELLGLERRFLLGKRFSKFISPDWVDRYYAHRRQCLDSRVRQTCEVQLKSDVENLRYVQLESVAAPDSEGNFNQIRMAMIDITDRKKSDERVKDLSRELLKSHETERQMISRELHDRIAQDLSALKMKCDTLLIDHSEIHTEITQKISELSKILKKTIIEVRDLSYDLRPPYLKKNDFIQSVGSFCKEFSEDTGIKVDFFSTGMKNIALNDFSKINIYRLVQEGLNNVRKHAQASHIDVTFFYSGPGILLSIIDNGKGFDVKKRRAT